MHNQTLILKLCEQQEVYIGKIRDVYSIGNQIVLFSSDRISAFDHVFEQEIPFKGQVLNQLATHFLNKTKHIVPNWLEISPLPNVSIGKKCDPIKLEIIVRGYLCGSAWRTYRSGNNTICGVEIPPNMKENQAFHEPIITPTLKADDGHDEDITREGILDLQIVSAQELDTIYEYAHILFKIGQELASERELILVDTKYEFGRYNGDIMLMDEIHTPDSSRYFYQDGYEEKLKRGLKQVQLSKEFFREWLLSVGFSGEKGQELPEIPQDIIDQISERYIDLYEKLTGISFQKKHEIEEIESTIRAYLEC